jgi:hypothetical protein
MRLQAMLKVPFSWTQAAKAGWPTVLFANKPLETCGLLALDPALRMIYSRCSLYVRRMCVYIPDGAAEQPCTRL